MKKALLFLNGEPPKFLPETSDYELIACTDGTLKYLIDKKFPPEKLSFVSGDFDSADTSLLKLLPNSCEVLSTPDQDKTDFEKALEIIKEKGFIKVDIFGGSGREQDHFLGNLSVAVRFQEEMDLRFYDEFSEFFFCPNSFKTKVEKGSVVSLFPFPIAENITTSGLQWPLKNENLDLKSRVGTRNIALENEITINFSSGNLLLFFGKKC